MYKVDNVINKSIIQERDIMENKPYALPIVFLSDNPENEKDDFKRRPFAQQIANILVSRNEINSIVIGIYGKWGEGKTTVLNFIIDELEKNENIICVKYNPWYYANEEMLFQDFFNVLSAKLKDIPSFDALNKLVEKYGKRVSKIASNTSINVVGLIQINPFASDSFLDLSESKDKIQGILKKQDIRIVVIMDDIDRLDKTEIQSIFKLVKLTANFNRLDFILAFDDEMVASAIGEKYGSGNNESGRSFLEKIINVPLHLPQASETALSKYLREGMAKNVIPLLKSGIKEEDYNNFWKQFYIGMQIRLKTPRLAKLYQNALIFSLPLLEDEVNLIDLMLIEGIRIFYPKMHNIIKSNAKLFVDQKAPIFQSELESEEIFNVKSEEIIQNIINEGFEGLYIQEQDSLKYLLNYLFPITRKVLQNQMVLNFDDQSLLRKDKKIASPYYFHRYFCYTVPTGDISDIEINYLIEIINGNKNLDNSEIENVSTQIMKMINVNEPESIYVFNSKILKLKNKLNIITSQKLVLALSNILKENLDELSKFVMVELLKTMKPEILIQCSKKLMESTVSTCFAFYIYETVLVEEMKISQVNIVDMKKILEKRIFDDLYSVSKTSEPFYLKYHCIYDIFNLLLEWGWKDKLSEYIEKSFSSKPDNALDFLKCFSTTVYGNGIYKEFMEQNYNFIKKFLNLDTLYNVLIENHANILDKITIEFHDNEETRILKSFLFMYRKEKNGQI